MTRDTSQWRFETKSVHAGYTPEPTTHAVAVPLYQTVAYSFDSAQHGADLFDLKVAGNIYTRIMNPTQAVLEERIAALEGGIAALALAFGPAASVAAVATGLALLLMGHSLGVRPFSVFSSAALSLAGVAAGVLESLFTNRTYTVWDPALSIRADAVTLNHERAGGPNAR